VVLAANKEPPVAAEYQLANSPLLMLTDKTGIRSPAQAVALEGLDGVGIGGQPHTGAMMTCWFSQLVVRLMALITTLVPAGIWLTTKLPPMPTTVPAVEVMLLAFVVIATE
jgi:hypothetical protein